MNLDEKKGIDFKIKEIKFECQRCGNCCTCDGYVFLSKLDYKRLLASKKFTAEELSKKYLTKVGYRLAFIDQADGACIFWDKINKACKIYDLRPTQCRTYPFWLSILNDNEKLEEEKSFCPGIGKGKTYNKQQIHERCYKNT